jgi:signal recognition particle GTPase
MFDNLTDRLSRTLRNISGRGRLTEDNIKDTLREVRMALLEADVACRWFVISSTASKKARLVMKSTKA